MYLLSEPVEITVFANGCIVCPLYENTPVYRMHLPLFPQGLYILLFCDSVFYVWLISDMESRSQTNVSDLSLMWLIEDPWCIAFLFLLFLSIHPVTVLRNLLVILAVSSDSHPHTPVYPFLSILSFDAICSSTAIIPKMVKTPKRSIRASLTKLPHPCLFCPAFSLLGKFSPRC